MRLFLLACLVTFAAASLESVDPAAASKSGAESVTDQQVVDALLKDGEQIKLSNKVDLKSFTTEYLVSKKFTLKFEEASGLLAKLLDPEETRGSDFLLNLGKILDLAENLKKKLDTCGDGKKKVADYVKHSLAADMKVSLVTAGNALQCKGGPTKSDADAMPTKLFAAVQSTFFDEMKKNLKSNPMMVYKMVLGYLKNFGLIGKETSPMVTLVAEQILAHPEVADYGVSFIESLEMFMKSESGKRFYAIIPQLMEVDSETALEIFAREADYNQEAFFGLLSNSDVASKFLKSVAKLIISGCSMAKEALADNMKFAMANGFLISNKFPALDRRNLMKSSIGIMEKGLKMFTTYRLDFDLYKEVKTFTDAFEKIYFKFDQFKDLTESELENVIGRFLQDNMLVPVQDAWLGSRFVTLQDKRCAEMVTCLFNENVRDSNDIMKSVTKGISMLMAWSWTSMDEELDYSRIYQAIWNGIGAKSCKEIYVASPKTCDVFSEKKQKVGMNLNYEHNEL